MHANKSHRPPPRILSTLIKHAFINFHFTPITEKTKLQPLLDMVRSIMDKAGVTTGRTIEPNDYRLPYLYPPPDLNACFVST